MKRLLYTRASGYKPCFQINSKYKYFLQILSTKLTFPLNIQTIHQSKADILIILIVRLLILSFIYIFIVFNFKNYNLEKKINYNWTMYESTLIISRTMVKIITLIPRSNVAVNEWAPSEVELWKWPEQQLHIRWR